MSGSQYIPYTQLISILSVIIISDFKYFTVLRILKNYSLNFQSNRLKFSFHNNLQFIIQNSKHAPAI